MRSPISERRKAVLREFSPNNPRYAPSEPDSPTGAPAQNNGGAQSPGMADPVQYINPYYTRQIAGNGLSPLAAYQQFLQTGQMAPMQGWTPFQAPEMPTMPAATQKQQSSPYSSNGESSPYSYTREFGSTFSLPQRIDANQGGWGGGYGVDGLGGSIGGFGGDGGSTSATSGSPDGPDGANAGQGFGGGGGGGGGSK